MGKFIFSDEIIEKFNNIGSKLYNLKHAYELYNIYIQNEANIPLDVLCMNLLINDYFQSIKNDYNKLEEDL